MRSVKTQIQIEHFVNTNTNTNTFVFEHNPASDVKLDTIILLTCINIIYYQFDEG